MIHGPLYPPGPKTDWSPLLRQRVEPVRRRVLGLDLSKLSDFTTLVVLDWTEANPTTPQPVYHVTALKRWAPGTVSWPELAAWLVRYFAQTDPDRHGQPPPYLVVSENIGRAVVEVIRGELGMASAAGGMVGITINAGSGWTQSTTEDGRYCVGGRELGAILMVLLSCHRLHVVETPETALLLRKAKSFTGEFTGTGNALEVDPHSGAFLRSRCWAAVNVVFPPWPPQPLVTCYRP